MAASTPPSRRTPHARPGTGGPRRASSDARGQQGAPRQGRPSSRSSGSQGGSSRDDRPNFAKGPRDRSPRRFDASSSSGAPRTGARATSGRSYRDDDNRGSRPPRPYRAREDDARGPRPPRPYRAREDDTRTSGSRPARPARSYRDDDNRGSRPPRPYRAREDDARGPRPPRPYRAREDDTRTSGSRPARSYRDDDNRGSRPPRPYRAGDSSARSSRAPSRTRDRAPEPLSPEQRQRQEAGDVAKKKGWGSVARKGAINITSTGHELGDPKSQSRAPEPVGAWEEVERTPRPAAPAKTKAKAPYSLPGDVAADVRKVFIGTAYMREKMVFTLTRAAEAYDRHRYEEALRLGRIVADATPGVAAVRELTGLAAYRAERWAMAKVHLRAYFVITNDPEHLPLVMDADRANHRYRAVEKTFEELQENEPSPEVLAEGRIVMAATWADQRRYEDAIELLTRAGAAKNLRNPSFRHVRLWYALADVYDRAGDMTAARELFSRIVLAEPEAYDAADRLRELGSSVPRKNRKRRVTPTSKKKVD